jgi:ergothioneine biosynthesis protein EgtB
MTVLAPIPAGDAPRPSTSSLWPDRRDQAGGWARAYRSVREETERRAAPLSAEDQCVQSMPDASPTKWHRAHTTWFFEQFVLTPRARDYRPFDPRFSYLFNSYYETVGARHARPKRGVITRPDCSEVTAYRAHVDRGMENLIAACSADDLAQLVDLIEIGLHHEQQHQELILTDILHVFSENPTAPAYDPAFRWPRAAGTGFCALGEGIHTVGHQGDGFCFDNEGPAHRALVGPVRIGRSLVTNGEWLAFMRDGGYARADLWLSDGWATVCAEGWRAPGHWREIDGAWQCFTLGGLQRIDEEASVCHVSYYEAEAFARWSGKHLPSEQEWEVAARAGELHDAFGIVWQWTRSAYSPYPAYRAAEGALGEYNGKFMVNQMVLRGSSLATPTGHARVSYRNFFPPAARWQFSGLRLADFA